MSDHEWCKDVARDEAARRTEDAAAQHRDLPEQVALLWASVGDIIGRVVRLEGEMDAGRDEEAAPAVCDSASPAEGLRTERVTLEVTQRVEDYVAPSRWNWCGQLGSHAQPGESVRVVEAATIGTGDVFADVQCGSTADEIVRLTAERDAAISERDEARAERDAAKEECERLRHLLKTKESECETHHPWVHPSAAPAANAGVEKQEPVAWGVRRSDGTWWRDCRATRGEMLSVVTGGGDANNVVSPLYAGPSRGWLTAEEREAVEAARCVALNECLVKLASVLSALLARSTPPMVKVPNLLQQNTWQSRDSQWIAAIRAAGGEVEG